VGLRRRARTPDSPVRAVTADDLLLRVMLDESEFLSPHGIRSVSRRHADDPFVYRAGDAEYRVDYAPGESVNGMFGGNSNWRGPIWFPLNYLLVEALQRYRHFYGDSLRVECSTGSGRWMTLEEVSFELSRRLASCSCRTRAGSVRRSPRPAPLRPIRRDDRCPADLPRVQSSAGGARGRRRARAGDASGSAAPPSATSLSPLPARRAARSGMRLLFGPHRATRSCSIVAPRHLAYSVDEKREELALGGAATRGRAARSGRTRRGLEERSSCWQCPHGGAHRFALATTAPSGGGDSGWNPLFDSSNQHAPGHPPRPRPPAPLAALQDVPVVAWYDPPSALVPRIPVTDKLRAPS
jgi:hypothetical protein